MKELEDADDEIYLILSECSFRVGREEMDNGHLHSARNYFDEALLCAAKTAYNTTALRAQISACFRYLTDMISGTLFSKQDISTDKSLYMLAAEDPFCRYILAIEALEKNNLAIVEELYRCLDDTQECCKIHLAARMSMAQEDYLQAAEYLNKILKSDMSVSIHVLYLVMCDLEICSREINDYKSAYEFSSSKIDLLQKMLSEVVDP